MSGVRTGTRLEQLEALARRVTHDRVSAYRRDDRREHARLSQLGDRIDDEIRVESRRLGMLVEQPVASRRKRAPTPTDRLLDELGISAREVKEWAVAQGLIPAVVRGRIKHRLVEAWAQAHPTPGPADVPAAAASSGQAPAL